MVLACKVYDAASMGCISQRRLLRTRLILRVHRNFATTIALNPNHRNPLSPDSISERHETSLLPRASQPSLQVLQSVAKAMVRYFQSGCFFTRSRESELCFVASCLSSCRASLSCLALACHCISSSCSLFRSRSN